MLRERKKRSEELRDWREGDRLDRVALWVGILGALLLHLLVFWGAPKIQSISDARLEALRAAEKKKDPFDVEFLPAPEAEKEPMFVEANPNVPDNAPDKTDLTAAQNQQAAQEKPAEKESESAPASKGEEDKRSTNLVMGTKEEPVEAPPPVVEPPREKVEMEVPAALAKNREEAPLPGIEKIEGENEEGIGSNVVKVPEKTNVGAEEVKGEKEVPKPERPVEGVYYHVDPKNPQPRQQLSQRTQTQRGRAAPLLNNEFGSKNIGPVAYSAKWSSYAEYMQKFIEAVQAQWDRILEQSRTYPPAGTSVEVKFRINSEGEIAEISSVKGSGVKMAEATCVSAITTRSPYGKWTEDMKRTLGDSQEITFTFYFY